jgi:DNA ligase-1
LVEIEEEAKNLPDNTMFDGELLAEGDFKDSIALRQATNSIANRKGVRTGLTYNVFDTVPLVDFKADSAVENALQRKALLAGLFGDMSLQHLTANYQNIIDMVKVDFDFRHIKPVAILGVIEDESGIAPLVEPIWRRGGEGVMLNTVYGLYQIKRSKDLLKVKKVESLDLPIVGFIEGTGKFAGMLGALEVEYKGVRVGVG